MSALLSTNANASTGENNANLRGGGGAKYGSTLATRASKAATSDQNGSLAKLLHGAKAPKALGKNSNIAARQYSRNGKEAAPTMALAHGSARAGSKKMVVQHVHGQDFAAGGMGVSQKMVLQVRQVLGSMAGLASLRVAARIQPRGF